MNDTRTYKSPSRERAKSKTRASVLEAVVKVILEQGIHAFTMQNVAETAGVSLRTVYRYFETREALLEGLQELIQAQADRAGLSVPQDSAKAMEIVGPLFEEFYRMRDAMHASVIAATALGYQTQQQRAGLEMLAKVLADRFEHLSATEIREAALVFRYTVSRYSWYVLAIDNDVPAEEAARAVTWSVKVLMDDLARRNLERAKEQGRGKPSRKLPRVKQGDAKKPPTKRNKP